LKKASALTNEEIAGELSELEAKWKSFREDLDGMAGSPGEWMIERMGELETEQKRRQKRRKG
jgi:hypothetical protein